MTTLLQLAQVCTHRPMERLAPLVEPYNAALPAALVTTPLREAMFLAQIAHESGEFRYMEESWGPTPAQARYEGRADLGNTQPGDGFRFRGRGVIQLTGRANYRRAGDALELALEAHPELAAQPIAAFRVAAWYWRLHDLNRLADQGDVAGCTRLINGGLNGLTSRRAFYALACAALGARPMATA